MALDNYYRPENPRRGNRFFPFLILIGLGILAVWGVSWWFQYQGTTENLEVNKVFIYFERGNGQILSWGETDWKRVYPGEVLWEGDTLRTGRSSRAVLVFYDGTIMRVDENSEVSLNRIEKKKSEQTAEVTIGRGSIWVNKQDDAEWYFSLLVRTDDLRITSPSTIFAITQKLDSWVRVLEGQVQVEVLDQDAEKERILETYNLGVGQEIEIGFGELEKLRALQPVSVVSRISGDFEESEWYQWNQQEDLRPTDFAEKTELPDLGENLDDEVEVGTGVNTDNSGILGEEIVSPELTVTFPAESPFETEKDSIDIIGTANAVTSKIKVNWLHQDEKDEYFLQHYELGAEDWRYSAAVKYDNMKVGENRYRITGFDVEGMESEVLEVIVNLVVEVSEEELTVPMVKSFNGEVVSGTDYTYTTDADRVEIKGSCSERTYKIVVNDFALSKKDPGSTDWLYFADVKYDNLAPGENIYKVYAEDLEGDKSEMMEFTIIKEENEAEDDSEEVSEEDLAEAARLQAFAQCLTHRGMKLYKRESCSFCKQQLAIFTGAVSELEIVDCDEQEDLCTEAGVQRIEVEVQLVPTWRYGKKNYEGVKTLSELGGISGCVY